MPAENGAPPMTAVLFGLAIAMALVVGTAGIALARLTASVRELRVESQRWAGPHPTRAPHAARLVAA